MNIIARKDREIKDYQDSGARVTRSKAFYKSKHPHPAYAHKQCMMSMSTLIDFLQ